MQGQRSAVGSLPEVLGFEHGSTSSDSSLEQPIRWNSLRNTSQSRIPDYMMSSDTSVGFQNAVNQPSQIQGEWDFGESSSRARQVEVSGNDQKTELGWPPSVNVSAGADSNGHRYGSSGLLSMNNVGVNMRDNGNNNRTFFVQSSGSETIPQDLNMNSDFVADEEDDDDDDCQVLSPSAFKSVVSASERMPSSSSLVSGGLHEGDGRRSSCKRKAIEGNAGQSSGSESSNYTQHGESSLWHDISARRSASNSLSIASSAENSTGLNLPEPVNPGLGLGVGAENSPSRTVTASAESSRRNLRLRIASQQQELRNSLLSRHANIGSSGISSSIPSFRALPRNNSLEHGLSPTITDPQGTPAVGHLLTSRRNSHSRWGQGPSSGTRAGSLSDPLYESEASGSVPRNLSEHPMFVPPSEIRNSSQNPTNWDLAGGNVNNTAQAASAPRSSSTSVGAPSSALPWTANRNPPHFPRRLSEYVRRAASLSSVDTEALGQSSSYPNLRPVPSASASASQDTSLPPGPSNPGRHASSSRSAMLLERHLDGAFGVPYSLRALAGAPEGRSRLMSEIRSVLDLMRRGEGLRFEDVMILDQSVFLGMADLHDRHRDMRLDVDNMSYEELLALEERIGNVNTGLTEEVILKQLKKRTHTHNTREDIEREPCCVCQEEYIEGVELGALDCGHDFHAECIKQWLTHKNLCPICKTTGLSKAA